MQVISQTISRSTGQDFSCVEQRAVGGGSINQTLQIKGQCGRYFFVKLNTASREEMFVAEAAGLQQLAEAKVIRIPTPICHGVSGAQSFLVLEHIALGGASAGAQAQLGLQLAALHACTAAQFGWKMNNTIGATPQMNSWNNDWVDFFRHQRLGYQRELAIKNGCSEQLADQCQQLMDQLENYFQHYDPVASLLHGDLWSGNVGFDENNAPVIFDPAVYFGDRESDLAMTELFGGFSEEFYQAYQQVLPLDAGYSVRKHIYKLYHVMNHFNLFGGAYASQAQRIVEKLLISPIK